MWMNNVRELAVNVDSVEARDEVNKDVVDTLRNLLEESGSNLLVGRVLLEVDGDQKLLGLSIDITDIDTTLVSEENPVTLLVIRGGY
jgi:hypothetical protein